MRKILSLSVLFASVCLVNACANGTASPPPSPRTATHFSVMAPANATTGSAFNFTVTALDASNNIVTSYSGTVHFTSSDGQASLPPDSKLTNGTATFSATEKTVGNETITATDTFSSSITGTSASIAVSSPQATHFSVSAPASAATGSAFNFTVTALDASNNIVAGYSGTVHFTSTDVQAVLPGNSPLTNGTGIFSATFKTAGNQSITATDTVTPSITSTSNPIFVTGSATHFLINAPSAVTTGLAFTILVTALDGSNNTVTTYSGTVHFTSTDATAVLPANATLTNGTGSFSATLKTIGSQSITATDTVTPSITGTNSINVGTAAPTHFSVIGPFSRTSLFSVIPGRAFTVTVNALDAANNPAPSYSGAVHFTSSDPHAVLPANSTLTNGVGTFSATLNTIGNQTITATDTVTPSITGTSSSIRAANLTITSGAPPNGTVGFSYGLTATGCLPGSEFRFFELLASGGSGYYTWSATSLPPGLQVTLFTIKGPPPCSPLGVSFPVIDGVPATAGTYNVVVTVKDSSSPPATASAAYTITINPAQGAKIKITSGSPPSGTVGQAYDLRCAQIPPCNVFSAGFSLLAAGGMQPYSWTLGGMVPPGLGLGSFQCLNVPRPAICGRPTAAGTYDISVTVTDSSSPPATASATYTITINPAQAVNAAALSKSDPPQQHHHYKLIDLGTFGGPNSYFNTLLATDGFFYGTAFYGNAQVSNGQGNFVGFADTLAPDPYSANPLFCYVPECLAVHAFEWKDGGKTDLGTLPGGVSSAAFWINSKGLIAGNSENGELDPVIPGLPELRAVTWKEGQIRDLGTLGGSSSFSQALNNRGQVTGLALNDVPDPFSFYYQFLYCFPQPQICPANATQTRGFVWDEENGMQDIGTLGGPDAFPSLINQHGQIAGFSYTDSTPQPTNGGFPTLHPFLWERGKGMKDLGSLGGTTTASVNGLNERGEVVGGSSLAGDAINHPFLWDGEKLIDLVAPPFANSGNGEANWINEAGEVVGLASLPTQCPGSQNNIVHAFLWREGAITDLGSVSGTSLSRADFINSQDQVVGGSWACDNSVFDGFLWESGSMVDLNDLLSEESSLHISWAPFINNEGVIGVFANTIDGDLHAVLLIPCDENHPNIEGCDYSPVDASVLAGAPPARAMPTASFPARTNRGGPPEAIKLLLRLHGVRSTTWFRRLAPQPQN